MAKKTFVDGNPQQQIPGTVVDAAFLNNVNNHYHDGLDVDGHGALPYVVDSGAADAYVATLNPALTQYIPGMPIFILISATNTGASTLNVNGLGVKAIKKHYNQALAAGDLVAGQMAEFIYDGINFQILSPVVPSLVGAYVRLHYSVASGENGGNVTGGIWNKRPLGEDIDVSGVCSVIANVITLAAGTYDIEAIMQTFNVNAAIPRLRNTTAGTTLVTGLSAYSWGTQAVLVLRGRFTVAAGQNLEIQQYATVNETSKSMGSPASIAGINEVYLIAELRKVG